MNETYVRDRIRDMLKSYGYRVDVQTDTIVCYQCHTPIVPPRGKADMTIVHPITGKGFYIEVKVIRRDETSFAFSRIENHQRRVLTAGGKCSYLGLGEIGPTKTSKGSRLLNIWLVPWTTWRAIEHRYMAFESRVSIPRTHVETLATEFATGKGLTPGWMLHTEHPLLPAIQRQQPTKYYRAFVPHSDKPFIWCTDADVDSLKLDYPGMTFRLVPKYVWDMDTQWS